MTEKRAERPSMLLVGGVGCFVVTTLQRVSGIFEKHLWWVALAVLKRAVLETCPKCNEWAMWAALQRRLTVSFSSQSTRDEMTRKLFGYMGEQGSRQVPSLRQGVDMVRSNLPGNLVVFSDALAAEYLSDQPPCDTRVIRAHHTSRNIAFAVNKNNTLRPTKELYPFLTSAVYQAKDRALFVAGDFNAHNNVGGHANNDRKVLNLGVSLWRERQALGVNGHS
ncbi:hypothetical protein HPB51_012969 [Rhipicephalus microplus]|uniref:Uncharacterized protein n=1 Tax=Rhipicephalus microplus TaxID=6941 RepID=A0A9J6F2L6_RHIMP|nr:hypothetical protein HPB51_012969 [Rhipicephalus microplus]